jgi:hypothetical protein
MFHWDAVTVLLNCAYTLTVPGTFAVKSPVADIVPITVLLVDHANGVTVAVVPSA